MIILMFIGVYPLPNPIIGEDGHYMAFSSVFGQNINNSGAPSELSGKKKANLGFNATQQHAKNTNTVILCEECGMWRIIFSKNKLSAQSRVDLANLLEDISYSCGATFDDIDLPQSLKSICIKSHKCYDPMEKLYYSAGFEPICMYCAALCDGSDQNYYPQCGDCTKPRVLRQRRSKN